MASIKDFAALKGLRQDLKAQEEARAAVEAERRRAEQQAAQDADLFRRSVGAVAPLAPAGKTVIAPPRPAPVARQRQADEQAALAESLSDLSPDTLLETDGALSWARPGIGPDVLRKLRRGQWAIQGQLDLHGLRTDPARDALGRFVSDAAKAGLRCLRIVHGKGLGSLNKEPVLKGKVRKWLMQKQEVIAFCQATAAEGGSGALIVLLRAQS